ncbi:MAG: GLUG motif-containing protein, partial [Rikenellaceae bacterium]
MKKLLFYIAAMAITIGCSDQIEEGLSTDPATPSEGTVPVKLYLTSEGDSAASRVVINDDLSVDWQVGDKIVAYSLEQKKTTEIYAKADETTGELYFEGELYTGKNRIYTGNVYNKNSDYAYVCLFTMLSTGSSTPIYPKMVSSDVIEIEESEDATVIKSYDIYMQHISAMVKLNLTFKNTPTDWAAILGDGFKISEIRLGGSPDSSTTEGDEYVDVMTYVKTDPTKGALEDGFLLEADGVYNYNISYSTSFLDSYTTPNYIADGDMLSIELAVDPSTFIIEDGEKLRIRLTFNPENSGDFNNIYVVDYISNNSGETFEAARATYNTINKTFDLGPVVYGDTWPNYAAESFAGGAGTSESPYQIATAEQLAYLSKVVALGGDSTDTYYELTDNINLEGQEWYPIGDSDNPFKGNFDGNDKSISNLTINITSSYQGLFGYAIAATIESVTLSEPSISGSSYVGAICGYAKGNSDNKGTTISKCSVDGGSVTGSSYVGAICGYAKGNSDNKGTTISKCCVDGGSVAGSSCVGAICGYAKGTTISKCCVDGGSVTGSGHVGGVVGENYTYSTVTECYNTGSVTGKSIYTGGVVGYNNTYSTVTECYNTGDVEGSSNCVGGVVGYNRDNSTVKECYNTGDVEGSSGYVGGVVGYNSNSSTATACYNTGSVEGSDYVGGVVGCNYSSSTVTECYNTGSVTGKGSYTGGVVGNNYSKS